jgi:hypothetical protein
MAAGGSFSEEDTVTYYELACRERQLKKPASKVICKHPEQES